MYEINPIYVITDKGLSALINNELPPSVFTLILRLVDGVIPFETFEIFLKEHCNIRPLFGFLHDEGLIALVRQVEEIKIAPEARLTTDLSVHDFIEQNKQFFDAAFIRKLVNEYIFLNHPHVVVGVMAMFDSFKTKDDFIGHRELYARLIAGDVNGSGKHIATIDELLNKPLELN